MGVPLPLLKKNKNELKYFDKVREPFAHLYGLLAFLWKFSLKVERERERGREREQGGEEREDK